MWSSSFYTGFFRSYRWVRLTEAERLSWPPAYALRTDRMPLLKRLALSSNTLPGEHSRIVTNIRIGTTIITKLQYEHLSAFSEGFRRLSVAKVVVVFQSFPDPPHWHDRNSATFAELRLNLFDDNGEVTDWWQPATGRVARFSKLQTKRQIIHFYKSKRESLSSFVVGMALSGGRTTTTNETSASIQGGIADSHTLVVTNR